MPWSCLSPSYIHVTLLGCHLFLLTQPVTAQQPPPWPESSSSYSSPMATALIVMIIVFFSIGFISVYLRHFITCFGFNSNGGLRRGRGGGRAREPTRRGLDPTILNTFPTFFYSDVKIHRVGKTTPLECAVCLSEFADHELLRLLPKCNHVFHPGCVDPWLASHVTCPVCRANLETVNQAPTDQTSDEESERPQPSDHDHVIIEVEPQAAAASASRDTMVKSPTQELLNGMNLSESGRIIRLPRSHSTGHSWVGDSDRFTLRLPVEVRNKLVNDNVVFTAANNNPIVSPRIGYRPTNMGWRFSMSPPFISRPTSPKLEASTVNNNANNNNNNNNITGPGRLLRSPGSIFRSLKSPSNKSPLHRVVSCNDIGERSSNRLWDNNRSPQDL